MLKSSLRGALISILIVIIIASIGTCGYASDSSNHAILDSLNERAQSYKADNKEESNNEMVMVLTIAGISVFVIVVVVVTGLIIRKNYYKNGGPPPLGASPEELANIRNEIRASRGKKPLKEPKQARQPRQPRPAKEPKVKEPKPGKEARNSRSRGVAPITIEGQPQVGQPAGNGQKTGIGRRRPVQTEVETQAPIPQRRRGQPAPEPTPENTRPIQRQRGVTNVETSVEESRPIQRQRGQTASNNTVENNQPIQRQRGNPIRQEEPRMASPNRIDRQTEKKASFEDEVEFDNLDFDLEEEIDFGEEEVETTPSVASEQPNSYNDDGDDLIEY